MNSKLIKELPELVRNDIISDEVSKNIQKYYEGRDAASPNKLFVVFGVLGAALIGIGILLILAHNWDDFSRSIKTIIAFVPLVIGQLCVGYALLKKKGKAWKEALGTFLFFGIGISMALVSQIYNIPGDFGTYLLTWVVLSLPLIYLLKSNSLALLHVVFLTYYSCEYGYGLGSYNPSPWMYFPMVLAVLPFYYNLLKQNATNNMVAILHWMLPLSSVTVMGAFIKTEWEFLSLIYIILFGLIYNIGSSSMLKQERLRRNGYLVIGSLGTVILLLIMSFKDLWKELSFEILMDTQEFYVVVALFVMAILVMVFSKNQHKKEQSNLFKYVFIAFSILFFVGMTSPGIATIGVNILVFVLGVIAIKKGTDGQCFGVLNYGLLIITTLIICRFFDTDLSFVLRGLLFVVIGVGFFLTNYIMLKQKNKKEIMK